MIVSIFKDDVSAQVNTLYAKADEARKRGDWDGFFNYSREALEVVNGWINRMNVKRCSLIEGFENDISNPNDTKQVMIGFNSLHLAIKKVELGLGEPKFDLRELNKNLLIKAV